MTLSAPALAPALSMAGASGLAGSFRPAGGYRGQTMDAGNIDEREAFTTLDGSTIREMAGRKSVPTEELRSAR